MDGFDVIKEIFKANPFAMLEHIESYKRPEHIILAPEMMAAFTAQADEPPSGQA